MIQRFIYLLAISLLFALSSPTSDLSPQVSSSLTVLITGPASLLSHVEQGFMKNLSTSLLQNVQFIKQEQSALLRNLLFSSTYLNSYDLIVVPRSAPAIILGTIVNGLKSIANPADIRLAIIDAGLVYATVFKEELSTTEELLGAEVPWQQDFVISVTTDPRRGRFQTTLSFLQAIGQNVFVFILGGETISVKSLLLENKTLGLAFGVHLEFDREPGAAAAAGRQDWSCQVRGKEAICRTEVDSVPQGGRLATGVAFVGATPGKVKDCRWIDKFGFLINYC